MSGSGLGLAIVKAVADGRGGTVELGDAPGGGARFIVRLPASPQHPEPVRPAEPAPGSARKRA